MPVSGSLLPLSILVMEGDHLKVQMTANYNREPYQAGTAMMVGTRIAKWEVEVC